MKSELRERLAYLSGCLHGDAWLTEVLGLRVKDLDFAEIFCQTIIDIYSIPAKVVIDERGYYLVRKHNGYGRFNSLKNFIPETEQEYAAWVRGLFDSEGNAQLTMSPQMGPRSCARRISMYSTNRHTLSSAKTYLSELGIECILRPEIVSKSHKGNKPLYVLSIRMSRDSAMKFLDSIGSSIKRKRDTINLIIGSYIDDLPALRREMQKKGAKTKHHKTMEKTLPLVIDGIRKLIQRGTKPTTRACYIIPGYLTIYKYFSQSELIKLAINESN